RGRAAAHGAVRDAAAHTAGVPGQDRHQHGGAAHLRRTAPVHAAAGGLGGGGGAGAAARVQGGGRLPPHRGARAGRGRASHRVRPAHVRRRRRRQGRGDRARPLDGPALDRRRPAHERRSRRGHHRAARHHQPPLQAQELRHPDHGPTGLVAKERRAMPETSVVVDHKRLTVFIADALAAMKMPRERAAVTAELMVRTDLRGVDSHGIDMLPRYHELWQEGFVVMDADAVLEKDSMATGLYDGAKGLGHWVSSLAMKLALDKARTYGIGIVTVRNSGHFGAAANYSMMALEHDMIGVATTNSAFIAMVPTFGRAPKLSTNP